MLKVSAWERFRAEGSRRLGNAGMGALRVTLLFGSAAFALTLIVAPITENQIRVQPSEVGFAVELDRITTGSIRLR